MNPLDPYLLPLKKRIRLLLVERHALAFGAVGAGLAVISVVLSKRFDQLNELWIPFLLVLLGLMTGAAYGYMRKLTPFAVARAVEKNLDLKERLSSAVRLTGSPDEDEVIRALLDDGARHIEGVDPKAVFPHVFSRGSKVFGFLVVLLVALIFLPQFPAFQSRERRAEVRVMKEEGKKLVKLAKELEKKPGPKNEEVIKRIAQNMKALGKKMEGGRISKKKAMLATKKLTKDIEKAQKKLAEDNASKTEKTAEQAGKDFKELGKPLDPEMQKKMAAIKSRMDQLAKLSKDGKLSSDQMKEFDKLSKELSRMKSGMRTSPEMLKKLADSLANGDNTKAMRTLEEIIEKLQNGEYTKGEMKKLAKELAALSQAVKGSPFEKLSTNLDRAAKALEEGKNLEAAKFLEKAAKMGQEIAKQLEDMRKLARAGGT